MTVSRTTPMNHISILSQRYHDRSVLIAKWKVSNDNVITFTSNSMPGEYYCSGEVIRQHPIEVKKTKNGSNFEVYVVPVDKLERLERV